MLFSIGKVDKIMRFTRDPERITPMLQKLEEAWREYPDMRLGQLIVVCAECNNIFGIEDEDLLKGIEKYYDNIKGANNKIEKLRGRKSEE